MLESKIEDWLTAEVEAMGGLSLKFVSPGSPGVPDRIYIFNGGVVWFVELKQQYGRMSNIQKWWREKFNERGCNHKVIKGMNEARAFLKELQATIPGEGGEDAV